MVNQEWNGTDSTLQALCPRLHGAFGIIGSVCEFECYGKKYAVDRTVVVKSVEWHLKLDYYNS